MSDINKNIKPIGVFDSGVGGLSVLVELERLLPNENFVFLADQLYVPYGEKTKKELVDLGLRVVDYFVKNHDAKMVVVACNTSTCSSIDEMRAKYTLPIVGTVPAVKTAAQNSKSGTIAVISTPSTSQSMVLANLIRDYCKNVKVLNIGCKNLEDTVEEGELESVKVKELLSKYLEKVKNSKTDCLVLGCTHYPFLKNAIRKIIGRQITLIDGNKAIATQAKSLLVNHILENTENKKGKTFYFTTGESVRFSKVASKLLRKKVKARKVAI